MFSQTDLPPRLRGMTWSTVRPDLRRAAVLAGPGVAGEDGAAGDLAAVGLAGDPHVVDRRITSGRSIVMCSEWSAPSRRSSSSAFSLSSSTAARLNVQTLIGSYVALSTRTRAMSLRELYAGARRP